MESTKNVMSLNLKARPRLRFDLDVELATIYVGKPREPEVRINKTG